MINPLDMADQTRDVVCAGTKRNYYRFRPAGFYGGVSTADSVGCCLRCVFCWSWKQVIKPGHYGNFHTPEEVAGKLVSIAGRKRYHQLRISGNEPTICREHLIRVLELVPDNLLFILETNGILIGADPGYSKDLARFPNLHVRVSLKGTCEEEFSELTGALPEGFQLQLRALENLLMDGVDVHPACMTSFSPPGNIRALRKRLRSMDSSFGDFEEEQLILYPAVEERLKKMTSLSFSGWKPEKPCGKAE